MRLCIVLACFGLFLEARSQDSEPSSIDRQPVEWDTAGADNARPNNELVDYDTLLNQWNPLYAFTLPNYASRLPKPDISNDGNIDPIGYPVNLTELSDSEYVLPQFYYPLIDDVTNAGLKDAVDKEEIKTEPAPADVQTISPDATTVVEPKALLVEPQNQGPHTYENFRIPNALMRRNFQFGMRGPNGNQPPIQYPFSPAFLPYLPPELDDGRYPRVDIFVRPPYPDSPGRQEPIRTDKPDVRPIDSISERTSASEVAPIPLPSRPPVAREYPFGIIPPYPTSYPFLPGLPPPGLPIGVPIPNIPLPPPNGNIIPSIPPPASENLVPDIPIPFKDSIIPGVPEINPIAGPPLPPVIPPPAASPLLQEREVAATGIKPVVDGPLVPDRTPYQFGFEMNDGRGTGQHRQEIKNEDGTVIGSYGYKDQNDVYRFVKYIADDKGFRAYINSNEPGVANPGSANVVMVAEKPPLQTVADSLRQVRLTPVEIPDVPQVFPVPTEIKK